MPITLQPSILKYKNGNGNYQNADCLKGDSAYIYIRYAAAQPTADSDMKTTADEWIGIYSGDAATAPTAYTAYTWYKIKGETGAAGQVQDVQVNGTTVLNAQGVANVPIATGSSVGVMYPLYGVEVNAAGGLKISKAANNFVRTGEGDFSPIVPSTVARAVFYGLPRAAGYEESGNTNFGTYTASAKSAISTMLSSPVSVTGTTPTITALSGIQYVCGEVSTLVLTLPASGIVDVVFESGSTATVLTITPPSGVTAVKWADGWDGVCEADTTYELNILNGELGVKAAWT